jgi:alpha-tubulin suppressor-like RCC1 family protein
LDLTTYDRDQLNRLCLVEKNQGRLAVGSSFFLAIFNPNKVGAWGFNYYGQLGQKKTSGGYTKKPKILSDLKKIKMVAAGTFHALALDYQGRVYAWGANKMGQLGFGISKDVYLPALIPGLEKIMAVYAIGGSSLVINDQGQVYQFGQFLRL